MSCAWQDEAIPLLRVLLNDTDSDNIEYDEGRLEELLLAAGRLIVLDISFSTTYTVSMLNYSISPNPLTQTDGDKFINFMALKAACLADISLLRTKALAAGIKAKCGPIELDTLNHLPGFKELITLGPCAAYEELKEQFKFGNTDAIKAVLSPFIGNDWMPPGTSNSSFFQ